MSKKKEKDQIKVRVIKGEYLENLKYNVQVLQSTDYGKNFWYCGYGRFCKNKKEVKAYIKAVYKAWYNGEGILLDRDFKYEK